MRCTYCCRPSTENPVSRLTDCDGVQTILPQLFYILNTTIQTRMSSTCLEVGPIGSEVKREKSSNFGENFRESQNLVSNCVMKISPQFLKPMLVKYFSPSLVIFSSNFLVDSKVTKKKRQSLPNFVNIL